MGDATSFINPFISQHVPEELWPALIQEFGRNATYLPNFDESQAQDITLIWEEGVAGEEVSPGRYSHALIRNSDLAAPPAQGDVLLKDDMQYDVVRVDAFATYCCRIVLQDRMEQL
jgi:hypothetical protein